MIISKLLWVYDGDFGSLWGSLGSLWAYDARVYAHGGAQNGKSAPHSSEEHGPGAPQRDFAERAETSGRGRGEGKGWSSLPYCAHS